MEGFEDEDGDDFDGEMRNMEDLEDYSDLMGASPDLVEVELDEGDDASAFDEFMQRNAADFETEDDEDIIGSDEEDEDEGDGEEDEDLLAATPDMDAPCDDELISSSSSSESSEEESGDSETEAEV